MTSRIKSALLRRAGSIKSASISGIKDTILAHRPNLSNNDSYMSNEYIHGKFFDDENYQSILDCLDGGYDILKDLLDYMQDHHDLQQEHIDRLNSISKKWKSKIKEQSSLSSYNTTKRAQLETIRTPHNDAKLLQTRCDAIKDVIGTFRREIERIYPKERFGGVHKHYRSDDMKKLFKAARSSLSGLFDTLKKLNEQQTKAQKSLHEADIQCENLSLELTPNKSKIESAANHQKKKKEKLDDIEKEIARIEEEIEKEEQIYRKNATEIYKQCREFEQERLELIGATLIQFTEAAYSPDYVTKQQTLYENLLTHFKTERNTLEDLNFWAETYGVYNTQRSVSSDVNNDDDNNNISTTRKTKKSHKNTPENLTTTSTVTVQQSIEENEEESSIADTTISTATSTKTKVKKNKN